MTFYEPTEEQRQELAEAHGTQVQGAGQLADHLRGRDHDGLVAVGDRVSRDLIAHDLVPDTAIVDGRERRSDLPGSFTLPVERSRTLTARNPAGVITKDGLDRVREATAVTAPSVVRVDGEEDLLALPALLFARPGTLVVYGHWEHGAMVLEAGEWTGWVRDIMGLDRHDHLILGGTWDSFHAGHRSLLLAALMHGERVDIGVTTDAFAEPRTDHELDPFEQRRGAVERFCDRHGAGERTSTMPIEDIYGNAVEEGDALVVTEDTLPNGEKINERRQQDGRNLLELIVVDRLQDEAGDVVSSSRIRAGAIDEDGFLQG